MRMGVIRSRMMITSIIILQRSDIVRDRTKFVASLGEATDRHLKTENAKTKCK